MAKINIQKVVRDFEEFVNNNTFSEGEEELILDTFRDLTCELLTGIKCGAHREIKKKYFRAKFFDGVEHNIDLVYMTVDKNCNIETDLSKILNIVG